MIVDNLALTTDNRIIDSCEGGSKKKWWAPGDCLEVKAQLMFMNSGAIEKANGKIIPTGIIVGYVIANRMSQNIWFTRRSSNGPVEGCIKAGKAVVMRKDDAIDLVSRFLFRVKNGAFRASGQYVHSMKSTIEKYLITIDNKQKNSWDFKFFCKEGVSKPPKIQIGEQGADGIWYVKNEYKDLFYDLIDPKKRSKTVK